MSFFNYLKKDKNFPSDLRGFVINIPLSFFPYFAYWFFILIDYIKYDAKNEKLVLMASIFIAIYFIVLFIAVRYRKYLSHKKWQK